ncbi:MalM family protein [Marinobacterium aestuariivivens]|uniref:MalM family protein n=1 Tax=Marinobacterium aestuariivivens TaxID=1698799 RepID=A0ABW2A646_9GAMM
MIEVKSLKGLLLILGLAVAAPVLATPCCKSLDALPYRDLPAGSTLEVRIDDQAPRFDFAEGESPFLAFRLPETGQRLEVSLKSLANGDLLQPSLMLLDEEFRPTRAFGSEAFRYQPARGFVSDALAGRIEIQSRYRGAPDNERYLIVYSTPEQRAGSTRLVHPAKTFALAQGNEPPNIADPVMPHGETGTLQLRASTNGGFALGRRLLQPLLGDVDTSHGQGQQRAPEGVRIARQEASAEAALPQTEAYYLAAIDRALAQDDLDLALQLAEEARRVGAGNARRHLLQQLQLRTAQ